MPRVVLTCLFVFTLLVSLVHEQTQAQRPSALSDGDCGCDHTHPLNVWKLDGAAINVQPGDVVCLGAGSRARMRIENVHGTAQEPVIVKNCGGPLEIEEGPYGISVGLSSHLQLTGAGDPGHFYGIRVGGTVGVGDLTTDIEVDHVEVYAAEFAGFMVKTDPTCDPATWRENFTMTDVSLHDNYAHHTGDGEGFYIGFTFYGGYDIICNGQTITVYGHVIEELDMYNNITYDTGADGIQVGSTPIGANIHDNVVQLYGQRPFANYQDNGIQIGAGTGGRLYNNWIGNGPGNGLIMMGQGDNVIFNNVIVDVGGHGIFCDERDDPVGTGYQFINNTIINPAQDGIRIYADLMEMNHIKNNIIVNPGTGAYVHKLNDSVPVEISHNLFVTSTTEAGFVDAAANDYHLTAVSPAVEGGLDAAVFGVYTDKDGVLRPYGPAYDIGAYEFLPTLRLSGSPGSQVIHLTWALDTTLPGEATWEIAYTGPTGSQPSPITGLDAALRAYTLTGLTNYETYNVTLAAMMENTAIYTDTITVMPTDRLVYLPAVSR